MDCPVCKEPMGSLEHEGHRLYRCIGCTGLLLSQETLKDIQKEDDERLKALLMGSEDHPSAKRGKRKCPACGKQMKSVAFEWDAGFEVDVCDPCGLIWLDGGEIRMVHEFTKKEHPEVIDSYLEFGSKKIFDWTRQMLITLSRNLPTVG